MAEDPEAVRGLRAAISAAAHTVVGMAASAWMAAVSALLAIAWVLIGLGTGFTQHWMSIMVAVTSVITFVMVFLIQHTTDRQSRALMLKLDELIRATSGARNELMAAERQPLEQQERLEQAVLDQAPAHQSTSDG